MNLERRRSIEVLFLLVLTDLVILAFHVGAYALGDQDDWYWSMTEERSFGESFQYIKELWLIFSFAALIRIRSNWLYLAFCLLFLYLFVDDIFQLHERLGSMIASTANFQGTLGLRAIDFGELLVSAIAGLFFVVVLGGSYWFGSKTFRRVCQRVLILISGLVFCGIALDVLHSVLKRFSWLEVWLDVLEDGGEMLFMSALCWYGISLLREKETPPLEALKVLQSQPGSPLQRQR
ncbi:hypothetical protein H6F89_13425 [Cyanobacteria bacterium FACHB-63]|nr:hypothetical protein [Cyanobacteria bacterium FACHB-63]